MSGRRHIFQTLIGLATLLLSGVALTGCALPVATDQDPAVVYLVRHAEKQLGNDPGLTADGQARAEDLVEALADARIDVIYSTDFQRTRDTAAPIALRRNLPIIFYDAGDLEGFAAKLRSDGRSALVVGHSNTTPGLVAALGGDAGLPITEATEYDRLYRLVLGAETSSTISRFGIPTPR
ncbi:MAG: histidine phosphatase family protein [Hyphomonadaceae bacterium]